MPFDFKFTFVDQLTTSYIILAMQASIRPSSCIIYLILILCLQHATFQQRDPGTSFFCEFYDFIEPVFQSKTRSQHRFFLVNIEEKFSRYFSFLLVTKPRHRCLLGNLKSFSACDFIKNETPAQAFSCEFREIFQRVALSGPVTHVLSYQIS